MVQGGIRSENDEMLENDDPSIRIAMFWSPKGKKSNGPAGEAGPLEVFDFESDRLLISVPHATLPGQAGGGGFEGFASAASPKVHWSLVLWRH